MITVRVRSSSPSRAFLISSRRWTCYTSSEALYKELLQYVRDGGTIASTRMPKEGQIEQGTYVNGVEVFTGYENSKDGTYTYLFAQY